MIPALRSQLETLTQQVQKVRDIRNKMIAHKERMTASESTGFWTDVALSNEDVIRLLQGLRALTTQLEKILWPPESGMHSWLMIAVDDETTDLIETLKEAYDHGIAPKAGFSPGLLPPRTCTPKRVAPKKPVPKGRKRGRS